MKRGRLSAVANYMISHVKWAFGLPNDKLVMVPNGVNTQNYRNDADVDLKDFRKQIRFT